jgi:hypothetical protein
MLSCLPRPDCTLAVMDTQVRGELYEN